MSGHSKWATTKRQKSIVDAKRGAAFTKVANMITIAAREGADPEFNFKLRLAVEKAKAVSMPKENIDRAISRGAGKGEGGQGVEELTYEAYGPGGIAIIITALTDNKMRAFTDIRTAISKHGGRMAEGGSVSYQFERKGVIFVEHQPKQADDLQLLIIDLGAEDFDTDEGLTRVVTEMKDLQKIRQGLLDAGYKVDEAKLDWLAKNKIEITNPPDNEKLEKLIDALDELEDVSEIATNIA